MDYSDAIVHKLWKTEMEILDEVDRICRDNGLKYSLAYGTLLGAIRHKGFIPWDDDIDIMMPSEDYNKLIDIWAKNASKEYIIQNKQTNEDFTQNFTKIRKDHTTFIHSEHQKTVGYHTGIFIDIFPGYRVAKGFFAKKMQRVACALNLLYARNHTSRNSNGLSHAIERSLLMLPNSAKRKIYVTTEKYISKWQFDLEQPWFFPCTIRSVHKHFPPYLFDKLLELPYEDRKYYCVAEWDQYLKTQYGDYNVLPPENERVLSHHPLIISFDCNADKTSQTP